MKRGNFIKLLATLVVAPTLMGEKTIEPFVEGKSNYELIGDRVRVYSDESTKCRVGDLIMSDMGDMACIVTIAHINKPYIEARPIIRDQYRYKSLNEFKVFARAASEFQTKK